MHAGRKGPGRHKECYLPDPAADQEKNDEQAEEDLGTMLALHEPQRPDHDDESYEHGQEPGGQESRDYAESFLRTALPEPLGWTNGLEHKAASGDVTLQEFKETMIHAGQPKDYADGCGGHTSGIYIQERHICGGEYPCFHPSF